MKHRFANYIFDDETRLLTGPKLPPQRLRPKVKDLLVTLLERPQKVVRKQELIKKIWGTDSNATDHDLQGLKRELEKALGSKGLISTVPAEGYVLSVPAKATNGAEAKSGVEESEKSNLLPIFPGLGTPAGALFVHSFVGYGKNDYVKHIRKQVKWERNPRHMVMLSNTSRTAFTIPFRHVVRPGSERESWWSVVIPVKVEPVSGDWQAVDFSHYSKLSFKARGRPKSRKNGSIFLRVRLEDDSNKSKSGSRRQSSSWYPEAFKLGSKFQTFRLSLDKFEWSAGAWPENTKPVNKQKIIQVVFGQDATVPSAEGLAEISDVALSTLDGPPLIVSKGKL